MSPVDSILLRSRSLSCECIEFVWAHFLANLILTISVLFTSTVLVIHALLFLSTKVVSYRIAGNFQGCKFSRNGSRALRRNFRSCNTRFSMPRNHKRCMSNTGAWEFLPVLIFVLTPSKKKTRKFPPIRYMFLCFAYFSFTGILTCFQIGLQSYFDLPYMYVTFVKYMYAVK